MTGYCGQKMEKGWGMSRPNSFTYIGVLLAFLVVFGGLPLLPGGLFLDTHEGDAYHMLDVLYRLEMGQRQHIDFVTPLGVLVFLPVSLLMKAGLSVGAAFLWAQVVVAVLLFPLVIYVALSRMPVLAAYLFGFFTLGLSLAVTYGTNDAGVSTSMQYNRWGWSISFVLVALALLPSRSVNRPVLDGALMGGLASVLLLTKITYFVCVVPPVVLMVLLRKEFSTFVAGVVVALLAAVAATLVFGPAMWLGYLADLNNVRGSVIRPFVGVPFQDIVAAPTFVGATLLGFGCVLLIGRRLDERLMLAVFLLFGGFLYVTYQNFANDPFWLLILPPLLLSLRPEADAESFYGMDQKRVMEFAAVAAIALIFAPLANLVHSPLKHNMISKENFVVMVPGLEGAEDLFVRRDRGHGAISYINLADTQDSWAQYRDDTGQPPLQKIGGVEIPYCELGAGSRALMKDVAAEMRAAGVAEDSQIFAGGLLRAYWMYGPFAPLQNGAPWYYGNLSGLQNADYLVVPKCAFSVRTRDVILDELNAADLSLELVRDSELMVLFRLK